MTCIKTEARVHFINYGVVVSADLFQVNDAVVVRTTRAPQELTSQPLAKATHSIETSVGGQNEFWREDLGVFVVPSICVKVLP